ncbi:hypothetical protein EDM80_01910 [bacterium]|nr:MAG: hypothetical protein EDM80_01910 [bacterium]MBV6515890.1 hypothetical protein [Planctomycetota bacterium]NUO16390.1 hypothetical protein [Planctomycetaceae bacterium]MCQ3951497.1 hypothetical protein [Planctomycetota bacterium]RIK64909.1 MAG: hypothetical protein DCC64_02200 [Planctomycetota bacterium]
MKFHLHVGVIETSDEATLEELLAVTRLGPRVLARVAPNVAILEREDAQSALEELEKRGLHPKVSK